MSVTVIHDILNLLCSSVSLVSQNPSQMVFSLSPAKEAQLAYDVLVAYGVDARVYHEDDWSKLYINQHDAIDPSKLAPALDHARILKNILSTMLSANQLKYKISFVNSPAMGKQISIEFLPDANQITQKSSHAPAVTAAQPAHRPKMAVQTPASQRGRKKKHTMMVGPTVAKQSLLVNQTGVRAWLRNYFVSHFAESFLPMVIMVFLVIAIVSAVVATKGFMCPDLAVVESKEWYCR